MTTAEDIKAQRGMLATRQQRKAADPQASVWVEASAGTGKTKVLSDRVMRLLLSGVAPAKILCLTYTKAAAVEMSNRIASRLSKWAVMSDENLDQELSALLGELPSDRKRYEFLTATARKLFALLLDTPGGMKIQTIHSFCQDILKRFPLEAGISPYFEVMDDRTKNEALEKIKNSLLQDAETGRDETLAQSLGYLTGNVSEFTFPDILTTITENAGKIIRLLHAYPEQSDLLNELGRRLNVSPEEDEPFLQKRLLGSVNIENLKKIAEAWQAGSDKENGKADLLFGILEQGLSESSYGLLKSLFLKKDGEMYAKYATKKALEFYPELNETAVELAEALRQTEEKMTAWRVFASTRAIMILAEALIGGYQKFKSDYARMDYDDLIMLTRKLLENKSVADWVLFKLDGGIDNVLIDEAQDTSPNQWAIVRSLTEAFFDGSGDAGKLRTIFVVGDRKQSIYSFQGADPREFEKMRQYFRQHAHNFNEINLEVSFRSTAAVLDSVNTVFKDETARQGVVLPDQDMTHIPFRSGEGGRVEIWPLIEAEKDENPDIWLPPVERKVSDSTSLRLAKAIAGRIKKMVEGKEILLSQGRAVRYGDFMILVQRRNALVEEIVRECKSIGVNIAGVDKIKLLEQIAIQDLISLGKFLLLPTDDLTLAEVLKSPLCGLDDDDLFVLCHDRGQASVWTRLGDNPKYKEVYVQLQTLLNMADFVRPFELYSYVLNVQGGRRKFCERMGTEVEDGLDEFMNLTLDFEQEHIPSMQMFIHWIGKDDIEIKRELEQNTQDAVRVMTVHASKGLQAPIVILPDTVRQVNAKKGMGMLWDDIFFYPLSSADYEGNCCRIKEKEQQDAAEEYRRLLYVALTRAEDRLCICGYMQNRKPEDDCWYNLCRRTISDIGLVEKDILFYESEQLAAPKTEIETHKASAIADAPAWLRHIPETEHPLAKPFTPSKPDETDEEDALFSPLYTDGGNRYRRGIVIHKLLQFLPDVRSDNKADVIQEFLLKNASEFNICQREKIQQEVLSLIENPDFAPLFGKDSLAEVPVMGEAGGKIISAQIDRLVVLPQEVRIVDFKTNRPAADTPQDVQNIYVKQLGAYKSLLERIYPDKTVKTFILWTDTARIMQIDV